MVEFGVFHFERSSWIGVTGCNRFEQNYVHANQCTWEYEKSFDICQNYRTPLFDY